MTISVTVTRTALTIKNCPPELADALAFVRSRVSFAHGDLENLTERISYAQYDAQTKVCRTYPNALHLVRAAVEKLGLIVEIQDQRPHPPLDLGCINKADCPGNAYRLLEGIAHFPSSGIILATEGNERTAIVRGLVRMQPRHFKILITSGEELAAAHIHESLVQAPIGERIGVHLKFKSAPARIMVTHLDALRDFAQGELAYSGCALRDFDVWICDEAHRVTEPGHFSLWSQLRTVYSWGLTGTPVRADNSHQLLSVIFGPQLGGANQEGLELQTATRQANPSPRVFVFPLSAPPIAANIQRHEKLRIAYLKNPALSATLTGIDANLPETAKAVILVDSLRLGIILHNQLPHYVYLATKQDAEHRRKIFDELRSGKVHRVIIHICPDAIDVPEVDYVVDCLFNSSPTGSRACRTSTGSGRHASHIMLLCLASEEFFNDGIAKLQRMNALDWQVMFMFDRKLVEHLPFAGAPLLPELGIFPER